MLKNSNDLLVVVCAIKRNLTINNFQIKLTQFKIKTLKINYKKLKC